MENDQIEYFDLMILLNHGVLDIRQVADKSKVSIGEYFSMLSKFVAEAPDVNNALVKMMSRDADKETYRTIDEMATLLKSLGGDKYIPGLYSILGAYETGNWRLAGYHAETLKDKFNEFYLIVVAANKTGVAEDLPDMSISLKKFIENLDEEQANRQLTILAVDDSPVILKSISELLGKKYKVYTLAKPQEIKKVLLRLTPDLFLLDYMMPEVDGFELLNVIRSLEEHKNTPVIYLTSKGTSDTVTAAVALGASDFVVKPFVPSVLLDKISKHIVRKKMA